MGLSFVSVVRYRSVRRADHSSRGFLPTEVRRCVWSRNLKNTKAIARVGGCIKIQFLGHSCHSVSQILEIKRLTGTQAEGV